MSDVLNIAKPTASVGGTLRLSPYQGLVPYSEEDADFFFGREQDTQVISSNLMASRLTVLYGASGVGKSSVLRAGVVHQLRRRARKDVDEYGRPEFVVVPFPFKRSSGESYSWRDDPIAGLSAGIQDSVAKVLKHVDTRAIEESTSLPGIFRAWTGSLGADLLIILDQFEEYLLYHGQEEGEGTFATQLARAINDPDLPVAFLIAIRDDSYAQLDRFKGRIQGLFNNSLRVDHLDQESARAAILKPIRQFNDLMGESWFSVEPELVPQVLKEVQSGQLTFGHAGKGVVTKGHGEDGSRNRVEAPYMQLVMERLWEEEMRAGSRVLRVATLANLGGAQHIVTSHLDDAMNALLQAERSIAARIFDHLVTPSGTKIAHNLKDLAYFAGTSETDLLPVMEKLSGDLRILRPVEPPPNQSTGQRYEIFHDVLAAPILDWNARYQVAQQGAKAEERLQREKREAETRARTARRKLRQLSLVAIGAGVVAVLVGIFAVWALQQKSAAEAARKTARSGELATRALEVLPADPRESLRLSLQALDISWTRQAESALRQALSENRVRRIFRGHTGIVVDLDFNPTWNDQGAKKTFVTAGDDGTARVWNVDGGPPIVLRGHTKGLNGARFSHSGDLVITTSDDGTARIWDAATGEQRGSPLSGHNGEVFSGEFSPQDDLVLTTGVDGTVRVWDAATGHPEWTKFDAHDGEPVATGVFSPKGDLVATGGYDGNVRMWDARTGTFVRELAPSVQPRWINRVAFSPNGKWVASAKDTGAADVWNVRTGNLKAAYCCQAKQVVAVAFSSDSRYILTVGDKTARVYDVKTESLLQDLRGHTDYVEDAAFSPSGDFILTSGSDGIARVWDRRTGVPILTLHGHTDIVWKGGFTPDGKSLVTISEDGTVRVWEAGSTTVLRGHSDYVLMAAFDSQGTRIITAGEDGTARVWDAVTGRMLSTLQDFSIGTVYGAVFTPDGKQVITAGDVDINFWDPAEPKGIKLTDRACCSVLAPNGGKYYVQGVAVSRDGKLIAASYSNLSVSIWNADTGVRLHTFDKHRPYFADFSPDSKWLVTANRDKSARVYDVRTWKERLVLRGHTGLIAQATFNSDGNRIVTASQDRTARIWDARSGKQILLLTGSITPLSSAVFSPDGKWVVAGGSDGSTRIWDARPSKEGPTLALLHMHADYVNSVAVSPDGKWILTASDDQTAKVFGCGDTCRPLDQVIREARNLLNLDRQ